MADDELTTEKLLELETRAELAELDRAEARQKAERTLTDWAETHARRDAVIRAAIADGVSVRRAAQLTGIARTTIIRILSAER